MLEKKCFVLTLGIWFFFLSLIVQADELRVKKILDRIETVTFDSKMMNSAKRFSVVLPASYDASKKDWPVLFFLHGRGRHDQTLVENEATRKVLLASPFVTVLPYGEDGFYMNSPIEKKDKYESQLEEMIEIAEKKYNLSKDVKKRGIAGWSMGGYGAVRYAETHNDQFGFVGSIVGLLDFPRDGLPEGQTYKVPVKKFGTDQDVWKKLNPISNPEKLRNSKIMLIAANNAFDRTMNENFHNRLTEFKIEHDWVMLKGEHKITVVYEAVPKIFERFTQVLKDHAKE
jgi:S-formylglutathione hydrolase FrmB